MLSKHERLTLILDRLSAARPVISAPDAFELLTSVMNEVEDEHSGVPFNPTAWQTDGRLYPPRPDHRVRDPRGRTEMEVECRRSKGHYTVAGPNGAMEIIDSRTREIVFRKRGADGRHLTEMA